MKRTDEVLEQGGFRRFLVAVLVAVVLGMLVRLSLSPAKIEKIIRVELEKSLIRENLTFVSAELSLADGLFPDLALILNRVEWREAEACGDTAPVRARLVRIPLRMTSLVTGKPSAGNIKIDDLTVDLDELKHRCHSRSGSATNARATLLAPVIARATAGEEYVNTGATRKSVPSEVWSAPDQAKIASMVSGIRVSRAEVFFENRMKSVVLEEFDASWRGADLDVSTSLKFPPATVFGENLPTFTIGATVRKNEIIAEIRADLSEGVLEANAVLKPVLAGGAKELEAELSLRVRDLPLSVVTPLLSKSKIVTGAFHPKFIWLDCGAEIRGVFSRLLVENPVVLSKCSVSGQVGHISMDAATRRPDGSWQPFEVTGEKIDIARILETFELQGPSGVFTNFGQVTGKLMLNGPDALVAKGRVDGAVIRFAGGEGAALQSISIGDVAAKLENHRWNVAFTDFKVEGGDADLTVAADLSSSGRDAKVGVKLKRLKLNTRVEKAIFTGAVDDISGAADFSTNFLGDAGVSKLARLKAALVIKGMKGMEINAEEVRVEAALTSEIEVIAKSESIEVLKSGRFFRLLQPALLGWKGEVANDGKSLVLGHVAVKGRFRDNGFQWSQATAKVGPLVSFKSQGHVYRDHAIESELEVRYPSVNRLKWIIGGTWLQPKFSTTSPELSALFIKAGLPKETVNGVVPPRLLGLPTGASIEGSDSSSVE